MAAPGSSVATPEQAVKTLEQSRILHAIDGVLGQRAILYGSLPPEARDLDLVVLPDDERAIAGCFNRDGFARHGRTWVSFRGCSASPVELIPAASLRLPVDEVTSLFEESLPVPGLSRITEPAPHHTLLIVAIKAAEDGGRLSPKRRSRIERAVARDPAAWDAAMARAGLWRASSQLKRLESLYLGRREQERLHWRRFVRRPRRTHVIAISSPNGDSASFQAESLHAALRSLGFDAVVERPASARDGLLGRAGGLEGVAAAIRLRRALWRHMGRGRVVIYDNYLLHAAFRKTRGSMGALRLQLLQLLAPRPLRSYSFDVPPNGGDRAGRRQPDRAGWPQFGTRVLTGAYSREELCREIAEEAWRALTRPGRLRSLLSSPSPRRR